MDENQPTILQEDNWRDTMHPPKLWGLNSFSLIAIVPFFAYWSVFTFWVAVFGLVFFSICQRKGLEPIEALKAVRSSMCGETRPILPANKRRFWT